MSGKTHRFTLTAFVPTLGASALLVTLAWSQQAKTPPQPSAIVTANERAAIATLRSIAAAQTQLAASVAIDTDDDGIGEYGFLGELAGTAMLRFYDPVADSPGLGNPPLSPPLLPAAFGNTWMDHRAEDVVELQGYLFKVFLPDRPYAHEVEGIAEDGPVGIGGSSGAGFPWPDTCETSWCCYAWPYQDQVTGHRAFFINQEGRVLQCTNDGRSVVYEGLVSPPEFDAAYSTQPAFPNGLTGMGAPLGIPPRQANDGNSWRAVR